MRLGLRVIVGFNEVASSPKGPARRPPITVMCSSTDNRGKAHARCVQSVLRCYIEDGRLTDFQGRTVDFHRTDLCVILWPSKHRFSNVGDRRRLVVGSASRFFLCRRWGTQVQPDSFVGELKSWRAIFRPDITQTVSDVIFVFLNSASVTSSRRSRNHGREVFKPHSWKGIETLITAGLQGAPRSKEGLQTPVTAPQARLRAVRDAPARRQPGRRSCLGPPQDGDFGCRRTRVDKQVVIRPKGWNRSRRNPNSAVLVRLDHSGIQHAIATLAARPSRRPAPGKRSALPRIARPSADVGVCLGAVTTQAALRKQLLADLVSQVVVRPLSAELQFDCCETGISEQPGSTDSPKAPIVQASTPKSHQARGHERGWSGRRRENWCGKLLSAPKFRPWAWRCESAFVLFS